MAKEKQNVPAPTPEQIEAWKKEFGDVFTLEVAQSAEKYEANTIAPDLDDLPKLTCYLRKPDRKVQNFAMVTMPKNLLAAGKSIVKECWLGGDMEIQSNDAYFSAVAFQAIELVELYQTRLKKL